MSTYIQYTMEDGSTVLVETETPAGSVIRSGRSNVDIIQNSKNFMEALSSIRGSVSALYKELNALEIDEAEVKFGLKAVGEAGIFAVGKVGGEMNYEVTLKWKQPTDKPKSRSKKQQ